MSVTLTGEIASQQAQVLYTNHHRWLYGWLRRRLGCAHTAEDLSHDAFLRLLAQTARPDPPSIQEPRAFLRVIANGLVVDHFRRRDLERSYHETLATLPEAEQISPENREIILEALHRIDAMLDRMPSKVRQAFLLSQLDGLTYAQIASRLGVSERTIKRYMQQAFAQCLALML